MPIEKFIFIAIAVMSIASLIYIPKEEVRKALLSFLIFQTTTWATSIALVEKGTIIYPVKEFTKAANVNFTPQFLLYPTIFMWFILLFPKNKNILMKIIHYGIFVSIMVWFIFFTSKYTNISVFPNSTDYSAIKNGYIRNFLQFAFSHLYITWFFNKEKST